MIDQAKYEISDLGEDAVSLRNPEFPLFGTEMSRAEFEEKLRENPMNDHLKTRWASMKRCLAAFLWLSISYCGAEMPSR